MIFLLFILIFILIIAFIYCMDETDKVGLFGTLACVTFVVGLIIVFVSGYTWDKLAEPMKSHEFEIIAMKDNHEMYILPRLWSCEGDTEVRYYFIRPWNGGVKQGWVPSDNSIIYQTDDEKPHIECYWKERIDKEEHPFWAIWFCQDDWDSCDRLGKEYHIYVPSGSVIEDEYSIDLE